MPWEQRVAGQAQKTFDEYNPVEQWIAEKGVDPDNLASMGRRIAAETAPAVMGAAAGARMAGPHPVARMVGGGLGGMWGALTGKRLDELFGNVRPDEQDLISDIITAAGGAASISSKAINPRTAREVAKVLERRGIMKPTPGMVSDSKIVQVIEQKLREIPFSGGTIDEAVKKIRQNFAAAVEHMSDDVTLRFASPSDAGKAIARGAQSKIDAFRARADELYRISNLLVREANPSVNTTNTLAFIEDFAGGYDNPKLVELLGDDLLKGLQESLGSGAQTWNDMQKLLRRIGDKTKFGSGEDIGTMKRLWGAIHEDMDAAIAGKDKVAEKAWLKAKNYWKRAIIGREEELAKIANDANPERLFNALMGKANLTSVMKARKAVDAHTWKSVQELVMRRMGEAPDTGEFSARQFLTNWKRMNFDSNAAKTLFKDKLPHMKELASIARRLEAPGLQANVSKTGAGNLKNAFLIGVPAAIGGASGDLSSIVTGATVGALSPAVIARIWTSPVLLKWMTRGKDIPISSYKSTSAWGKAFLKLAVAEGINESDALDVFDLIMAPHTEEGSDIPSVPTQ